MSSIHQRRECAAGRVHNSARCVPLQSCRRLAQRGGIAAACTCADGSMRRWHAHCGHIVGTLFGSIMLQFAPPAPKMEDIVARWNRICTIIGAETPEDVITYWEGLKTKGIQVKSCTCTRQSCVCVPLHSCGVQRDGGREAGRIYAGYISFLEILRTIEGACVVVGWDIYCKPGQLRPSLNSYLALWIIWNVHNRREFELETFLLRILQLICS